MGFDIGAYKKCPARLNLDRYKQISGAIVALTGTALPCDKTILILALHTLKSFINKKYIYLNILIEIMSVCHEPVTANTILINYLGKK